MRRTVLFFYFAMIAIVALLSSRTAVRSLEYILDGRSSGAILLIIAGWSLATFAAPLLSVIISTRRGRSKARWIPHAVFIPCAITGYWVGASTFFAIAGVGGEDIVAEYALVCATGLLLLTLLFHATAMIRAMVATTPQSANGS